jgi:hypothetical protein
MGRMAGNTLSPADRSMGYAFRKRFLLLCMTGKTEITYIILEQSLMGCNMRIMAGCTLTFIQWLMHNLFLKQSFLVALETDILGQDISRRKKNCQACY